MADRTSTGPCATEITAAAYRHCALAWMCKAHVDRVRQASSRRSQAALSLERIRGGQASVPCVGWPQLHFLRRSFGSATSIFRRPELDRMACSGSVAAQVFPLSCCVLSRGSTYGVHLSFPILWQQTDVRGALCSAALHTPSSIPISTVLCLF